MKISLNWLREFVDIPDDAQTLGKKVTGVGLAVDAIEQKNGDTVYEFDITTNRPDCLNHLGVAREVGAIYSGSVRKPRFELSEGGEDTADVFSIGIADPDLCGRYCGRYIEGVKIGPSPEWLKKRLEVLGLRSINNVADVTNLVMMELGQPLHAFDADTLQNQQIIVRRAAVDEKITTLDGQSRTLNPSVLVIADAHRPVAIAGVMGGAETEISGATTNVLLESAYFFPAGIRKTVRALGLSTEASYRYERGADIEIAEYACDRAAALIQQVSGGRVLRGVIDVYPAPFQAARASLRRQRIRAFLGAPVPDEAVERIFAALGFALTATVDGWDAVAPSFRVDITNEEDLLEEVARHYGYDNFPPTLPPFAGSGSGLTYEREERQLRNLLSSFGYSEIYGLSFTDEATEREFGHAAEPVRLLNPMSEDWTLLRSSLVSSVLRAIEWNVHRGNRDLQLFELGKVYRSGSEKRTLVLAATGAIRQKSVHETPREFDFYDVKADVEAILREFDVDSTAGREDLARYYHPGRAARLGPAAVAGELHPDFAASIKPRQRVYIAELDVDTIIRSRRLRQAATPPKEPSIRRDLSVLLDRRITYESVRRIIEEAGIAELIRFEPFDRLDRGAFADSRYSLSISFVYQSPERTLTGEEVEAFDRKILGLLEKHLGADLRK
jgi:phenylalanyl-tRNA synthetase beta chain